MIFHEYAIDVAIACHGYGVQSVAVAAGEVCPEPRAEFYQFMDAANVDLKAFTERFYREIRPAHLDPVLETLKYLKHHTQVWLELTTLLIPGENDSDQELDAMTRWVTDDLGPDVPMPGLSSRLSHAGQTANSAINAAACPEDRDGQRRVVRVHGQRS